MTNNNAEDTKRKIYKQRLKTSKKEKLTCAECKNQTFILGLCSDFPFFDAICSKCGSINIFPIR